VSRGGVAWSSGIDHGDPARARPENGTPVGRSPTDHQDVGEAA
jgi:hypothetical protein